MELLSVYFLCNFFAIPAATTPIRLSVTGRRIRLMLVSFFAIVIMSGLVDRLKQIKGDTAVEQIIVADVSDTLGFPFKGLVEKQLKETGSLAEVAPGPGMHRFFDLIKANVITEDTGMRFATNPEALKMNLKGIFIESGQSILGR